MNKIVSASEFKAKCLKLIEEMQQDGVPVTITKRGKPVAELKPKRQKPAKELFGMLRHPAYRYDANPSEPAIDPGVWDAMR